MMPSQSTSLKRSTPLARSTVPMKRTAMKRSRKRVTVAEGGKYLAACRDEPCYLNARCEWSDWADPTVVDCHSNQAKHGKGFGLKAKPWFTVPGCGKCHEWLDRSGASFEEKCAVFDDALERWLPRRTRKMGLTFDVLSEQT